ncbi:MAG: hypothetical protein KBB32_06910 [Spirochaetia bacterium]|nr:hypothetical protein [Spirochaetia bacterium]
MARRNKETTTVNVRRILTAAILATIAHAAFAQATLSVSLYDKRIYTPGSEIPVKVTIRNDGAASFRFKLAEQRVRSLGFDVRSVSNRALDASDAWKRAMASNTPVYYREIALNPGEEYSFVENLADYVSIQEPGAYVVRCSFWPELYGVPAQTLNSNALSISVRPGVPSPSAAELFRAEASAALKPERVPPDVVVTRTIVARQKSQWNEFFLYLDLERLLKTNPNEKRAYDRESDDGRRRMLENYRAKLMEGTIDGAIVVIPSSFEIIETRYRASTGTVTAILKFEYSNFHEVKEYTYELEKRDDVWYIVAYTVQNKGTE